MKRTSIMFYRVEVSDCFKVAMKVVKHSVNGSRDVVSTTILEDVPKGLLIGVEYST
jgi:hypothetical protein